MYCWGFNFDGSLGIGALTEPQPPVQVGTATDWVGVSAGAFHTCGIRSGGALYCWGDNAAGQLGDGTTMQRTSPRREVTASTWRQVSASGGAGGSHTCAIRNDRALFCWGDNADGQLGDGTNMQRRSPTQEVTHATWRQVSAGSGHTCAIRTDGSLYCWGWNSKGRLGDGTTTSRSQPTQEVTHAQWNQVSAGGGHTCGIQPPGHAYCWGDNAAGSLGLGSSDDGVHSTPTVIGYRGEEGLITPLPGWVSVSVGTHSQGLRIP